MMRYAYGPVVFKICTKPKEINFKLERVHVEFGIEDIFPHYEGSYTIIPRTYEQTMDTENHVMDNNVTITKIPLTAVSNIQGGKTLTIG